MTSKPTVLVLFPDGVNPELLQVGNMVQFADTPGRSYFALDAAKIKSLPLNKHPVGKKQYKAVAQSSLNVTLTNFLQGSAARHKDTYLYIEGAETISSLDQWQNTLKVLVTDEQALKWIKAADRNEMWLVVETHAYKDAKVETWTGAGSSMSANGQVPVGLLAGLPPFIGQALNVGAEAKRERDVSQAGSYTVEGDKIFAVAYMRVHVKYPFKLSSPKAGKLPTMYFADHRSHAEPIKPQLIEVEEQNIAFYCEAIQIRQERPVFRTVPVSDT